MKLSEIFKDPEELEGKFRKIVDGQDPLRRAVEEAADPENDPPRREIWRKKLEKAGEKVMDGTNLGEIFSERELLKVSRNGREEFREYLLDYGRFGILFDFRNDRVTTHT